MASGTIPLPESGSNSNGNYIKFVDGTLIQWGTKTLQSGSTSSYSPIFILSTSFNLPVAFVDDTYIVTGASKFGTGAALAIGQEYSSCTTSEAWVRVWDVTSRTLNSSFKCLITWMAVGRWK